MLFEDVELFGVGLVLGHAALLQLSLAGFYERVAITPIESVLSVDTIPVKGNYGVAVKEFSLSYMNKETLLSTIYPY